MITFFGVDLAAEVGGILTDELPRLTLLRVSEGGRQPGALTAGNLGGITRHVCAGFVDENTAVIVSKSLPSGVEPREDDRILFGEREQVIESIAYDPAKAVYTCVLANN